MDDKEETLLLEICDDNIECSKRALKEVLVAHGLNVLKAIKNILRTKGNQISTQDMADDIFQEVVTSLLYKAQNGDLLNVNSLEGYLFNAARLCTLAYLKKKARPKELLVDVTSTFWRETDQIIDSLKMDALELRELEGAIYDCIEELPDKQKDYMIILAQHYEDPPTPKEIAQMCGVSSESVRNRLMEARSNMEKCLQSKGQSIPKFRSKRSS